jgi:hypothetical protein
MYTLFFFYRSSGVGPSGPPQSYAPPQEEMRLLRQFAEGAAFK